jgi:hypothetical protein
VLGWYPITSSFIGAAVPGAAVADGVAVVVPEGWVQPAVNSKRARAMHAIAIILIDFMRTVLSCRSLKSARLWQIFSIFVIEN